MRLAHVTRRLVRRFVILFGSWAMSAAAVDVLWQSADGVPVRASGYEAGGRSIQFSIAFAPVVGTDLTVIDNTGREFIDGVFDNLDHGQVVELQYAGQRFVFVANYFGGTGNDLVLVWKTRRVYAWGFNAYGAVGDGTTISRLAPAPVRATDVLEGKTILRLASGNGHSLALASDGTLAAWGSNAEGQLGIGAPYGALVPVAVDITSASSALHGKRVSAIAAASGTSFALCDDGTATAWSKGRHPLSPFWANTSAPGAAMKDEGKKADTHYARAIRTGCHAGRHRRIGWASRPVRQDRAPRE